mgnify:CR=1 FL=1
MDKAQILALADRVEALTGPDRGVDADIVLFICRGATVGHYTADDDGDIVFHAAAIGIRDKSTCPHFTASLDAAMTLVPEGFVFSLDTFSSPAVAKVYLVRHDNCCVHTKRHTCATPALALTAASLRAMAGGQTNA